MISFIVPAYNEEFELSSTIAAIGVAASGVSQPYEIVVVDDASTDATAKVSTAADVRVSSMRIRGLNGRILSKELRLWKPVTRAAVRAL